MNPLFSYIFIALVWKGIAYKCLPVWYGCNGAHHPHRTYLAVFGNGECKLPTVVALLYAVSAYLCSSANMLAFNNQ